MKIEQSIWTQSEGWTPPSIGSLGVLAQLVLVFGGTNLLKEGTFFEQIKKVYPQAYFFGCSTAGEISGTVVQDDSLVITAVHFEKSAVKGTYVEFPNGQDSYAVGEQLAGAIEKKDLVHVFVLSDGLKINGSELVRGLEKHLPENVKVTGGLSGDGARFKETFVISGGLPKKNTVGLLGFYGNALKIGYGSVDGWDPFGPERIITRSRGNILYELDGQSALELYKKYLGEKADGLPSTGLLFPLSIRGKDGKGSIVRTILAINEEEHSLTFAGDVPEGSYARLMRANFDRLIDGAAQAAKTSQDVFGRSEVELAILISCVGRKLILKQRVEEEIEGVKETVGEKAVLTGFYSYGEIAPFGVNTKCLLHNQTMTVTLFSER